MTWMPYRSFTLNSKLSSIEIRKKFETNIPEFAKNDSELLNVIFTNPRNTDSFIGNFTSGHFTIREKVDIQVGGYINAFRPEAIVSVNESSEGTVNRITIKPNLGVIVFMLIMIVGVLIAAIYYLTDQGKEFLSFPMLMLLFPFLIYFVATSAFNSDLPQLESFIDDFLEIDYAD